MRRVFLTAILSLIISPLVLGRALDVGDGFACREQKGGVECWGSNEDGQLGDGTEADAGLAIGVRGLQPMEPGQPRHAAVSAVVAGRAHACALMAETSAQSVVCWGSNASGQLGSGAELGARARTPVLLWQGTGAMNLSLTAGDSHTCLAFNGGLRCWGNNASGQLGVPPSVPAPAGVEVFPSGSGVKQVAAGSFFTCAIVADGVQCWGGNPHGQIGKDPSVVAWASNPDWVMPFAASASPAVTEITAGSNHACALRANGKVFCWGSNSKGQLGRGTGASSEPIPLSLNTSVGSFMAVDAGGDVTCAKGSLPDSLWCWGANTFGMVGNFSMQDALSPVQVVMNDLSPNVLEFSVGAANVCARDAVVTRCWGRQGFGANGDGSDERVLAPVPVEGLENGAVSSTITTALRHSCVNSDGGAYCWGSGVALGLGPGVQEPVIAPVAQPVDGLPIGSSVTSFSASVSHSCAIANGKIYCWGSRSSGRLGDGELGNDIITSAIEIDAGLPDEDPLLQISTGAAHTCARSAAKLLCWGNDGSGNLGRGTLSGAAYLPGLVSTASGLDMTQLTDLAAGAEHTCAVSAQKVWCWGLNTSSQLGSTVGAMTSYPTAAALGTNSFTRVSAANRRSCGTRGGKITCWGDAGPIPVLDSVTKLSIGNRHACAIANSKLLCWGDNTFGQLGLRRYDRDSSDDGVAYEVELAGVSDVDVSDTHTCAIAGNRPYCWGDGVLGLVGDNDLKIAAGPMSAVLTAGIFASGFEE